MKEVEKAMFENEAMIIEMNQAQLYKGLDSKAQSLGEYSQRTIEYKIDAGQPSDRVTLKDRGDFYKGMKLFKDDKGVYVDSEDEKTGKLTSVYGENIFGLVERDKDTLTIEKINPYITIALQRAINE